jgi:two-component system response regulator FlrC
MRILIIGTLGGYVKISAQIAKTKGAKISIAQNVEEGLLMLRKGQGADLIWTDADGDIKKIYQSFMQERFAIPIIACGVRVCAKEAEQALIDGAKDYIHLPPDPVMIADLIESISNQRYKLLCKDPKMLDIVEFSKKIAISDASVLITGESGTGKEVMANFIHQHSKRHKKPFISLNCAAIPENLLESELFGHEKGAFTGAIARRIGKFEEASSGTLFLDEVSEMHPRLQAKLLRALQERIIDRVGGNQPIPVDIRIIATSNRNMQEAVQKGDFRQDLFFRLNVINVHLPPLRERISDLHILVPFFIERFCQFNGLDLKQITPKAFELLENAMWPGNVRQLENVIHRAVLVSNNTFIDTSDISIESSSPNIEYKKENNFFKEFMGKSLACVEQDFIHHTILHCQGDYQQAAIMLGISLKSLSNKIAEQHYQNDHSSKFYE